MLYVNIQHYTNIIDNTNHILYLLKNRLFFIQYMENINSRIIDF